MRPRVEHNFHAFSAAERETLKKQLLLWYDENKRSLPWRFDSPAAVASDLSKDSENDDGNSNNNKSNDGDHNNIGKTINNNDNDRGYAVLVSEIMLQQTRVATVLDFYVKWMKKWPTLRLFAEASLEEGWCWEEAWRKVGRRSKVGRSRKSLINGYGKRLSDMLDRRAALSPLKNLLLHPYPPTATDADSWILELKMIKND